jgi:hypothetical protein
MKRLLLVVVFALGGYGIWGTASALLHPRPMTIGCAQYVDSRPNATRHHFRDSDSETSYAADWVELTKCEIDLTGMIYEQSRVLSRIKKVFIPVRPLGSSPGDLTRILICSTSADDIRLAKELRGASPGKVPVLSEESLRWMNVRTSQRTVRGMVDHDLGFIAGLRLEGASLSLKDGFVILNENRTPSAVPAVCSLIAAVCGAAILIRFPALTTQNSIYPVPPSLGTPPPLPKRGDHLH